MLQHRTFFLALYTYTAHRFGLWILAVCKDMYVSGVSEKADYMTERLIIDAVMYS